MPRTMIRRSVSAPLNTGPLNTATTTTSGSLPSNNNNNSNTHHLSSGLLLPPAPHSNARSSSSASASASTETLILSITASYIHCARLITQCHSLRAQRLRYRRRPASSAAPGAECAPVPPPTPYCSLSASYAVSHGEVKSVYDAGVGALGTVFVEGRDPFLKRLWAQSQALLVSIDILASLLAHPAILHMPLPLADLLATSETARRVCIAALADQYAHLAGSLRPRKAIPASLALPPKRRAPWKTLLHETLTSSSPSSSASSSPTHRRGSSVSLSSSLSSLSTTSLSSSSSSPPSLYSPARSCSLQSTPRTRPSLSQLKEEPEPDREDTACLGADLLLLHEHDRRLSASTIASQFTQLPDPDMDAAVYDDECMFKTVLMPRPRRLLSPTTATAPVLPPVSPMRAATNKPSTPPLTPRLTVTAASLSSTPVSSPKLPQVLCEDGDDNDNNVYQEEDDEEEDVDSNRLSTITIPARYPSGIFPQNSVFSAFCPEALSLQVDPLRPLPPALSSFAENQTEARTCRRCDYVWRKRATIGRVGGAPVLVHTSKRGDAAAVMLKDGFCMTQRFLAKSHTDSNGFGCVLCTSTGKTDIYGSVDSLRDHLNACHTKWQMLHDRDLSSGIQP